METGTALPVFLLFGIVAAMAIGMLAVALLFNPKQYIGPVQKMPYESGMDPIHDTRRRFDVRFHLIAIAFLVFDVELLFLYPWAVASRPAVAPEAVAASADAGTTVASPPGISAAVEEGLASSRHLVFAGAMTFFVLLALGFIYDWRKGVFRWR